MNNIKNGINIAKTRFFEERDSTIDPQSPIQKVGHPSCKNPSKASGIVCYFWNLMLLVIKMGLSTFCVWVYLFLSGKAEVFRLLFIHQIVIEDPTHFLALRISLFLGNLISMHLNLQKLVFVKLLKTSL